MAKKEAPAPEGERNSSNSIFWRTFLMLMVLIVVSVLGGLQTYWTFNEESIAQSISQQIVSMTNLTRYALISADPVYRPDLLNILASEEGLRIVPKELSGGEMRRVSIARALMNKPKLLIADEPTGDLDAESTAIVMRLLQEVAHDGTAVLMVTHDPDALTYVDRIYRMDRGVLAEA